MNNGKVKFLLTLISGLLVMGFSGMAFAQGSDGANDSNGMVALACGLGIGLAAFGGGLGQGRAAAAALEGIARNPGAASKIMTPMILGLALIESLVIYALVISILLLGKV